MLAARRESFEIAGGKRKKWKKENKEGGEKRKEKGRNRGGVSYLLFSDLNGRPDGKRSENKTGEPSSNRW